ncbi:SMI1/KNR4 family protein [Kitasatospora aureofaciens]|uniref:SMI1/KNR4 family protein n=1 Tax=Kitasatospora aureofaciens TaxID=1894 RepID=UPI0037C98825
MTEDEIVGALRANPGTDELPPPAAPRAVAAAEKELGFPLPPLLRRLYVEVANGGFGPRGGITGVRGGPWSGDLMDIIDGYLGFSSAPDDVYQHTAGLVPLLDEGCGIHWLIDCRDVAGPMWGFNPNRCSCHGLTHALTPQGMTLAEWLARFLDGRHEMPVHVDPVQAPCTS